MRWLGYACTCVLQRVFFVGGLTTFTALRLGGGAACALPAVASVSNVGLEFICYWLTDVPFAQLGRVVPRRLIFRPDGRVIVLPPELH